MAALVVCCQERAWEGWDQGALRDKVRSRTQNTERLNLVLIHTLDQDIWEHQRTGLDLL